MSSPTPGHGERACYLRGCRRTECADAHYRYMSRYRYERAHGQTRRVDAAPASDHVQQLVAAGWSRKQIADAARISHCAARSLADRRYRETRADMAARVLALPLGPPPIGLGRFSPATGTVRRLRALMAIGHTLADISTVTGIHRCNLGKIARTFPDRVETHTARAVAAAYRQMSTRPGASARPGASTRARYTAARLGWHGPLDWDDIDNPDEQPDNDTDEADADAPRFLALAEDGLWLERTQGYSRKNAAARLGVTPDNLQASISRARKQGHLELGEAA